MERIKRVTVITFLALFLSAAVIFALLFFESGKTEDVYKRAVNAIENKEWEEAYDLIKQVPHYKSSQEIEKYVYPIMAYYKEYDTSQDKLNGMEVVSTHIDSILEEIQNDEYKKNLSELKETIAFQKEKMNVLVQYDQETKLLEGSIELIKSGKLAEAETQLASVNSIRFILEKKQLSAYVKLLHAAAVGDKKSIEEAAALLNPAYTGSLSQDIRTVVVQHMDEDRWNKLYQEAAAKAAKEEAENTKGEGNALQKVSTIASIGDGRSSVIKTMGNPVSIQTIDSSFGKCEKLVYAGDVIVYIEDGEVTAVKG